MKQTLIKITDDHYVVVDDSEIKEGDYVYIDCPEIEVKDIRKVNDYYNEQFLFENGGQIHIDYCKKITHSIDISWIEIDYIPLSEVKELIGDVDVEKNMWYERNVQNPYPSDSLLHTGFNKGFELGYNQAIEDNKDRKYTEEDLRNAYRHGTTVNHGTKEHFNSFIQSFQPKTEWEVTFDEQGKLRLV